MAHITLLFVGTVCNLNQIYADCPDSSSESCAEMAFGADYINEERGGGEFTRHSPLYQNVLDGMFGYCYDIRNTKKYGDFNCINGCFVEGRSDEEERAVTIQRIKELPDDTVFFFADSHW